MTKKKSRSAAPSAGAPTSSTRRAAATATQPTRRAAATSTRPARRAPSATSRWPLVVRIVSFAAAAVLTIAGIIGLTQAVRTQSAAQSVTSASVRGESVRHVLVLMSYDEADASTGQVRDALVGAFGPSGINADVFCLDARSVDYGLAGWESELTQGADGQAAAAPGADADSSADAAPDDGSDAGTPAVSNTTAADPQAQPELEVDPEPEPEVDGASAPAAATPAATRAELASRIAAKAEATGSYDAIVCAGDEALAYVLVSQDVFAGLPVAFLAVDDLALAEAAHASGVAAGIVEQGAPALALATAARLAPTAARAVVLTDDTLQSAGLAAQLAAAAAADDAPIPALALDTWDASALTPAELESRLAALDPASDVVLLLGAARTAGTGDAPATRTPSDATHAIAAATTAPIVTAGGGVGEGAWAAPFTDRAQEAADVAALAVDLLNGTDPATIATTSAAPSCTVYDVQALEAAGIDPGTLPADAALVNEAALSWRVLRPMLRPALFLLGAIVCVAIFGLIGFRRTSASRRAILETNRSLQHRLTHDLLTELPNRQALESFAQEASGGRGKALRSVVQLDIEGFSDVNDSYGHAFGNEVIREVARRLSELPASLVARTGGDEFVLCVDHTLTPADPLFAQVDEVFAKPVSALGNKVELSVRTGVANRARASSVEPEELIVRADLACQHAKSSGERAPVFYDASMRDAMERRIEIAGVLKRAIAEDAVDVVWQPQVDTATLEVYGYEALCRLREAGVGPADFIPVAEMSGLVLPLDRIVTRKVVEQLGAWLAQGRTPGVASINFSAAQLRDEGYVDFLAELLERHGVPGSLIKVEVTESMLLGKESAADAYFERLADLGVGFALDDFGTGYSSLARMAHFPAQFVKLDKSLVDSFMVSGQEDFVDHLCQLVHDIGKRLVVEGVETAEQFAICRRLGCDIIQGYYFSRPVGAAEAIDFDPRSVIVGELPPLGAAGEGAGAGDAAAVAGDAPSASFAGGIADGGAAPGASSDKTRNRDWSTYKRDANGRWTKKR